MTVPQLEHEPEATKLTRVAWDEAGIVFQRGVPLGAPLIESVTVGGARFYLEVHGQSSVTGHGCQGLRPDRLDKIRALDAEAPVRLAFCEGWGSWRCAWLRDLDARGPARAIKLADAVDRDQMRYGWPVRWLEEKGRLCVPEEGPALPPGFGTLMGRADE